MSIKLTDSGAVMIAVGGDPTEDSDCCCNEGEGCSPCALIIENISDFSQFDCISRQTATSLPSWNGSFCANGADHYQSNPDLGPCEATATLSVDGRFILLFSEILLASPNNWELYIYISDAPIPPGCGYHLLWAGSLNSPSPIGVYTAFSAGCSNVSPPSLNVTAC